MADGTRGNIYVGINGATQTALNAKAALPTNSSITLGTTFVVTQAYSDVAGGAMAVVGSTPVQLVITAAASERVLVSFSGTVTGGTSNDIIFGYQVDSDTAIICGYALLNADTKPICFTKLSAALSAGSHTIKFVASKGTATGASVLGTSVGNYGSNAFEVIRF